MAHWSAAEGLRSSLKALRCTPKPLCGTPKPFAARRRRFALSGERSELPAAFCRTAMRLRSVPERFCGDSTPRRRSRRAVGFPQWPAEVLRCGCLRRAIVSVQARYGKGLIEALAAAFKARGVDGLGRSNLKTFARHCLANGEHPARFGRRCLPNPCPPCRPVARPLPGATMPGCCACAGTSAKVCYAHDRRTKGWGGEFGSHGFSRPPRFHSRPPRASVSALQGLSRRCRESGPQRLRLPPLPWRFGLSAAASRILSR
jgi:hypothetical protein